LLYQSVSTDLNGFRPSCFVDLDDAALAAKQKALDCHESQKGKDFMQMLRTEGVARGWGANLRHPEAAFEAFEVRRAYWWNQSPRAIKSAS
jgi:hypothetical protein